MLIIFLNIVMNEEKKETAKRINLPSQESIKMLKKEKTTSTWKY